MTGQNPEAGGKAAFLADLSDLRERSGRPSYKKIADLSDSLRHLYPPPEGVECRYVSLSTTAISEVLRGKRKRLPGFDWVASYVLCCQRLASALGIIDDPGTSSLTGWLERWKTRQADASDASEGDDGSLRSPPLPLHQQTFLAEFGPYGQTLLHRLQAGDPEDVYQVAILLATDPAHSRDAEPLLHRAAAAKHAHAMELLDRDSVDLLPSAAARQALTLAESAEATGALDQAHAFYRAAARGGVTARRLPSQACGRSDIPLADIPIQPSLRHPYPRPGTDPASRSGPAS